MPQVRSFAAEDLDTVADMFQRLLRKSNAPVSDDLRTYLRLMFLDASNVDPEMPSKVHVRDDGSVSGFLGVIPLMMEYEGRQVRVAICTSFVSEDRDDDPFAGARLLRDVLAGPQDLSFGETADDVSTEMWRKMRGKVLAPYSLEWVRILRPASFALNMVAGRFSGILGLLRPLSTVADRFVARRGQGRSWSHYTPHTEKADAFIAHDANDEEFTDLSLNLLKSFHLRPDWSRETLLSMLEHAQRKALHGERVQRIVKTRSGKPIGLFLYYGNPGNIGRTVQIMAIPGQESIVIDRLFRDAFDRGLVAIRGRTQPALLDTMIGKKCAFLHASSTVVHSRDPEILKSATDGTAFLNGLAGESWTRLIGDRFD
jgi:hypothetical protein